MIKQKINKFVSGLTLIVMLSSISAPVFANSIIEQDNVTNIENVTFDATIQNGHSYTADIQKGTTIDIELDVKNEGYLKSAKIVFENNNYKIEKIENDNIKSIEDNKIELAQIEAGKKVTLNIPVTFEKNEKINVDYFNRESNVKLEATYINAQGKEESITKEVRENLSWDAEAQGNIEQQVQRYLKYEDKTLISFKVTDAITNDVMPVMSREYTIAVPELDGKQPAKVIVTGENIQYNYQNNVLKITKKQDEAEQIDWTTKEEYIVTYVYDNQVNDTKIKQDINETVTFVNGKTINEIVKENEYQLKEQIGNLLETNVNGIDELSKGYLYTNLHREEKIETNYSVEYSVNVGYSELLDKIKVKEFQTDSSILDKKVRVSKDEITSILGEEGYIQIFDSKDIEIARLDKDNTEAEISSYGIKIETSNPISEGNITFKIEKSINTEKNYTKEEIKNAISIQNDIRIEGTLQDNIISSNIVKKQIKLIEPTSNATIQVNKEELSTAAKNEDVIITTTLEKDSIDDMLYTQPKIRIKMPSQVTNIELKDAKLIYEEELQPTRFETNGNEIILEMKGTQTQYSNIPTAKGAVIRIVANLTLNQLSVSSNENVVLEYSNEEDKSIKTVTTPIKVVAPDGFINVNRAELGKKQAYALQSDDKLEVAANDKEKEVTLGGTIISNQEQSTSGVQILGRVPSTNETSLSDGQSLQSKFDMKLSSLINVQNATVYYSDNGNADSNLSNESNGWTTEAKDTSKSYLIVLNSNVEHGQSISFEYKAIVPKNLDYEMEAKSQYAIIYNNDEGNQAKIVSKTVSIETDNVPVIQTKITASDYKTGEEITSEDGIISRERVIYTISITNTGKKTAENVESTVIIPEDSGIYVREYVEEGGWYNTYYDWNTKEKTEKLSSIAAGETKEYTIDIIAPFKSSNDQSQDLRVKVVADNADEESTASISNKILDGQLSLELSDDNSDKSAAIGSDIAYTLSLDNKKGETIHNVQISINIPKSITLSNYDGWDYNKDTRTLTYKLDELQYVKYLEFKAKVTSSETPNEKIEMQAVATYDEYDKEVKSDKSVISIDDVKGFEASITSNIQGALSDNNQLEYYITVKNNSYKDATIRIGDTLPTEVALTKYIVSNAGVVKEYNSMSSGIAVQEEVKAGTEITITLVMNIHPVEPGKSIEITNEPMAYVNEIPLYFDEIKTTINSSRQSDDASEITKKPTYSIYGNAWYDENSNGKRDTLEKGIKGVSVGLISKTTGNKVQDVNGNPLTVTTNENGEYRFENLENDTYIVYASYDKDQFEITEYKKDDVEDSLNSDFIETIIDGQSIAATDAIDIDNENQYNVNLGLRDKQKLEINVESKVSKLTVVYKDKKSQVFEGDITSVELNKKKLENSNIIVEYTITVKNTGNVAGYAKSVVDYIPSGMEFRSELNPDWYKVNNSEVVNTSIANEIIDAGESKELKIIFTKHITNNELGIIHNTVGLKQVNDSYNVKKLNVKSGIIQDTESISDLVIHSKVNVAKMMIYSAIIIGMILAVIYVVNKKIIKI